MFQTFISFRYPGSQLVCNWQLFYFKQRWRVVFAKYNVTQSEHNALNIKKQGYAFNIKKKQIVFPITNAQNLICFQYQYKDMLSISIQGYTFNSKCKDMPSTANERICLQKQMQGYAFNIKCKDMLSI